MYDCNSRQGFDMTKLQVLSGLNGIVKRRHIFFHPIRSCNFVGALMCDQRISRARKVAFVVVTLTVVALMLFPSLVEETFLSAILPILGTILGIPLDLSFNWAALALLSVTLLRIFPSEVVDEHYSTYILLKPVIEAQAKLVTQ